MDSALTDTAGASKPAINRPIRISATAANVLAAINFRRLFTCNVIAHRVPLVFPRTRRAWHSERPICYEALSTLNVPKPSACVTNCDCRGHFLDMRGSTQTRPDTLESGGALIDSHPEGLTGQKGQTDSASL